MSYSLTGSYLSSPDEHSAVFPDRLIRPLPKRSLRSRLSQEAADAIPFPPNPPSTSLPNYTQYGENGEYSNEDKTHVQRNGHVCEYHHHDDDDDDHLDDEYHCHHHHHCHHDHEEDDDGDSGDDASPVVMRRSIGYRNNPRSPRNSRYSRHSHTSKLNTSGLDGYDAFENTNNKKKRKIPTSGSMGLHHSGLPADLAHLGLNGSKDGSMGEDGAGVGQYYGSGSAAMPAGMGIQGAGRGRNGRRISGRHPLGLSTNGSNVRSRARSDQLSGQSFEAKDETAKPDQGIISAAIANATALLRKPLQKGQENLGVLDQESKAAPKNSQFTFTCDPDTGKGVAFPEQSLYAAGYSQRSSNMPNSVANSKFSTHGTQTSPNIAYQNNQNVQASQQTGAAQPASAAQGKKTRRRRGDAYAFAARQRRLQQEYSNMHHPPSPENIWICEFCEYEGIFGEPPAALIRQYEIKDRRERRKQAERRRLLEKAKLKARKGKKQSKNGTKAGNNTQQASSQGYDQQPMDPVPGEDYLDDGYDDDPIPMPAPPQAPVKQPMPGSFDTAVGATGKGGAG